MVEQATRIALYVHQLTHTGVARNAAALAARLAAAGHSVDLVTAIPGEPAPAGVHSHVVLPRAGRKRFLEHVAAIAPLRRYLRTRRPALAISMGNHGHPVVWAASRGLADIARVYRISNDLRRTAAGAPRSNPLKRWLRPRFTRRLVEDASAIVVIHSALLDDPVLASALAAGKVRIISNGVDVDGARRLARAPSPHPWLDDDVPVVLAIGRLAPQKNFATLLKAVARLNQSQPVRLIILGESRDRSRDDLLAMARQLAIADRLLLAGGSGNVFAWLSRADVFAFPSWWEGFGLVLLEAMAVGTPIVASRTAGAARELLGDGRGLLVDPGDADGLADAIAAQLDPATRVPPGDKVEAYDFTATAAAWQALIGELTDRPRA